MGTLLKAVMRIKGGLIKRSFDQATKDPQITQTKLLLDILRNNRETEYGKEHAFSRITTADAFIKRVPLNTFFDLAAYVERIKNGQRNILTAEQPFMFNLTSGTTDTPKYVPVTQRGMTLTARLSTQWLYRALQDHPSFLDLSFLFMSGAPVEGKTPSGIPYGSASGMIYKNLPRVLHGSFAVPFVVSKIKDYDLRYHVIVRISLEKEISCIVTPNPTTLIRITETGIQRQEELIRSIQDGVLFSTRCFDISENDSWILNLISANLKPNRTRACFLQKVMDRHGNLMPFACWKKLKLVGCWLGGSVGFQANKFRPPDLMGYFRGGRGIGMIPKTRVGARQKNRKRV